MTGHEAQPVAEPEPAVPAAQGVVHSTRYRRWTGRLGSGWWTWLAMVVYGVRVSLKSQWNIMLLLPGLGLALGGAGIFYLLSFLEYTAGTEEANAFYGFIRAMVGVDISKVSEIGEYRYVLWKTVLLMFVKIEMFYLLLIVGTFGPGLIADDLKSRALPIYFARPITPLTYLLGKWATIALFMSVGMLLPNLLMILGGTVVAGGLETWTQTLTLTLQVTTIAVGTLLAGGLFILAISSLTADKRYATVGWFAAMLMSAMAQAILFDELPRDATRTWLGSIAPGRNVEVLSEWLLGVRAAWEQTPLPRQAYQAALGRPVEPLYPALVLGGLVLLAAIVVYRRVTVFSQRAANI